MSLDQCSANALLDLQYGITVPCFFIQDKTYNVTTDIISVQKKYTEWYILIHVDRGVVIPVTPDNSNNSKWCSLLMAEGYGH